MKEDLDRLMKERDLDALVVQGAVHGNPPLYYLLNGAGLTQAVVVKKRGDVPRVIVNPMEREEAAVIPYPQILSTRYDYRGLLKAHHGDKRAAWVAYMRRIFDDLEVRGRVGFYGLMEAGAAFTLLSALAEASPELEVVGELENNVILAARTTKDAPEIARIREVGRRTIEVIKQTVAFLQSHRVGDDETLRRADGSVLTVGAVHEHIRRGIALQGLEDPEGFIFATGRDAGIPHSKGTMDRPMRLGESIVFDIFPREAGGGYFFDMTRTFCLGYAPEPVAQLHRDVLECSQTVKAQLAVGEPIRRFQPLTCEFFQARGHPTIADTPDTMRGYVHSLGHGVGLNLHELPFLREAPKDETVLTPGHVFTIEPGLYYPERGMGCRIEDVMCIDGDGVVQNLTPYPYDLVIPME